MAEKIAGKKLVVIVTAGPEDPEKASFPYLMASTALTMDVQVTVAVQGRGVYTVTKGVYETIKAPGIKPLKELVDSVTKMGGKILV